MLTAFSYIYDATGRKVRKVVQNNVLSQNTVTDYAHRFQYENNIVQFFPTAEGYATRLTTKIEETGRLVKIPIEELPEDQFSYVYNYTDHLGNIRLSYAQDPDTQQLKIVEQNHYYPFGLRHTNYSGGKMQVVKEQEFKRMAPTPEELLSYKYKYNGKEYQDELGLNMYDYGARNYDAALGRWMNVDPKAETSRRWNPYTYCYNNPLRFVDPDGMKAVENDDWKKDKDGNYVYDYKLNKDNSELLLKDGEKYVGETATVTSGYGKNEDGTIKEITTSHTLNSDGTVTDQIANKNLENGESVSLTTGETITSISTSEKVAKNIRWLLEGGETIGGYMELAGLLAAPSTEGVSLASTVVGGYLSLGCSLANSVLDVYEGDYKMAGYRLAKTAFFAGMGKAIDNAAGNNVTDFVMMSLYTNLVLDKTVSPVFEPKR